MKDIQKVGNPTCSICGALARFDCPTNEGPWAYLCDSCFEIHTTPARASIGYRFIDNPTPKAPEVDSLITSLTGISRIEAATKGICTWCKKKLTPFRDELSRKEYKISGMCQACQDVTFEEPEE